MEQSTSDELPLFRNATIQELNLLGTLIAKGDNVQIDVNWPEMIEVQEMNDGGMGSLRLRIGGQCANPLMGRVASEESFNDVDGMTVIASLILDKNDMPMELDIWKVDFSPLIRMPANR